MFRNIKIAGFCLASMLVMGMALAGDASAVELLWLVCLKGTGLTRYTNSRCLTAGSGEWQSLGLLPKQEVTVKILAITITMRDTRLGIGIICFGKGSRGEGVIKAKGEGEIRVAEFEKPDENCRSLAGCEEGSITQLKGVHLPWKQELVVGENGKPLGVIRPGASGEPPGYAVTCKVAKIAATDTCTEETGHPEKVELLNAVTKNPSGVEELLVKSRFETVGHAKCSLGGENASEITGSTAILLPGGAVSIKT